ncbi:MAG: cobalamin-binding protein [Bryobacterales bacterium]|nr:cobalamin-binding protein [Bryobacterales bacterium]
MLAALILLVATLLHAEPKRVVSTAPSFTETAFALGAGDRVVGVSTYCHYPPQVTKLPKVGTYLKPNIEAIVRLKPDLVLVHAEHQNEVRQLQSLGIETLPLQNTSLDDTLVTIRQIGAKLVLTTKATALETSLRRQLDTLRKQSANQPRKTILFVVGRTPGTLDGLIAVGRGSFLNELMLVAGGRNVLDDSPVTYPRISLEGVLRLNPDVIVDMGDMAETVGVTEAHKQSVVALWTRNPALKAVQQKRVFAVAADIFVVPGPRLTEAAQAFYEMMHR